MFVTPLGITRPDTSVRLVQPLKVLFMFVTLAGITGAVVRDVQLEKV